MPFRETKVYFDGSHYIAIPHTRRPQRARKELLEEKITVVKELPEREQKESAPACMDAPFPITDKKEQKTEDKENSKAVFEQADEVKRTLTSEYTITPKELFNNLYDEYNDLSRVKRRKAIIAAMCPYFKNEEYTAQYVDKHLARKLNNLISRRIRCVRKANLQDFNYFVTFTYSDKLHTEESFKKRLRKCLSNFCVRKGWKYIGVWELSPKNKRLHFHGIFSIPEGTMPGYFEYVNDYNFNTHKRQITVQSTYFNDNFGRSDFEVIDNKSKLGNAIAYLLKYIEKTGEKIVYSKGMPQFFISDIIDEDVLCRTGMEDKKLLLFDDFMCWDEGCRMGRVSKEVIKHMRPSN